MAHNSSVARSPLTVFRSNSARVVGSPEVRQKTLCLLKASERQESIEGTSKNGPVIDLLSMAPDVSWVRRGLVNAISGFSCISRMNH
jgi:hypothetical protein